MSKRLILMFCLVLGIGLMASVAYAEVQSIKVSGDLTTILVNRHGFNLCDVTTQDDQGVIAQTRVRFDADLTDGVSATIRLLNERDWGFTEEGATTDTSDIDLDLAYVTLQEFLYSPLTLIVGRQELRLGSGLIIGDPDTNQTSIAQLPAGTRDLSVRKAFDGIVSILDYDPTVVTLAYLKDAEGNWNDERDDVTVFLANVAYDFQDDMSTSAEAYVVIQDNVTGSPGANDVDDIRNLGMRVVSTPIDSLVVTGEGCWQTANAGVGDRADNAWVATATYDLGDDIEWIDTIGVDYTRLGKDWNVMYEDQIPADIANAMFNNTNMQIIGATVTAKPRDDISLRLRYANLRMIQHQSAGSSTLTATNYTFRETATGKKLGDEIDLSVVYDYTEDVQLGLSLGYFDPDNAFQAPKEEAAQVVGSMKVSF